MSVRVSSKEHFEISRATVVRELVALLSLDAIESTGKGRGVCYTGESTGTIFSTMENS